MTEISYEVFPITLREQHVVLLQDQHASRLTPWMIPHQPHLHPNTQIIQALTRSLREEFQPEKSVVHSTSWRYEEAEDHLLLTYLAILPQGQLLDTWLEAAHMTQEPIGDLHLAQGNNLHPPAHITHQNVLAHALDHLALLITSDPAIETVLGAEWHAILRYRRPQGAGRL
ncbi:hypothetical protein KSC_028070 [Ktedonobacter sp. SOSP1-52]|uniref:hypothetical protein n=1 Tax=Ktedonobacter sp. SOSP1-52 TaxID=2778366 RepID=UPI001915ED47|nr:hypothetical protein [Ktedonobacter sp. SOSP1-52]GHO63915.1 hypothetical protein KSC_028070 [Ktedonobacter sp. SOSP1-52]